MTRWLLIAIAVLIGLLGWARLQATSAISKLETAQSTIRTQKVELEASTARETALAAVVQSRDSTRLHRKQEIKIERKQDAVALVVDKAWAEQPLPAGIVERLRGIDSTDGKGSPSRSPVSAD